MRVSFNNLPSTLQERSAVFAKLSKDILRSGTLFNGKYSKLLVRKLQSIFPHRYILLTASGHDGLVLALKALKLKPKDEVLFPVNSYPTFFPVALCGVKPKAIDVNQNALISPEKIKNSLNKNTRAVIVTHLYGNVADSKKIGSILHGKGIFLIEDCAQSFGSTLAGKLSGNFGDIGCFSLYPTKNLATVGDGGFMVIKDRNVYQYCKQALAYGENKEYFSQFASFHSRLSEINAAYTFLILKDFKNKKKKIRQIFNLYLKHFSKMKLNVKLNIVNQNDGEVFPHLFVLSVPKRDELRKYLNRLGIPTSIHYPYLVSKLPAYKSYQNKQIKYPQAEYLTKTILDLPFGEHLTEKEIKYIVKSIHDFYYD